MDRDEYGMKIKELEATIGGLLDDVDGLESELTDCGQSADEMHEAILDAISDLRALAEVPLQDLETAIEAVAVQLLDSL